MTILVLSAILATSQAAPQERVVTVQKKSSKWSFAVIPEHKMKEKNQEFDVPAQIVVAWYGPIMKSVNPFELDAQLLTVEFYQAGKRYQDEDTAEYHRINGSREALAEVAKALLEHFFEFDIDFPGGAWEDLAKVLKERLAAAYGQQLPEPLKAHLPAKIEIEAPTRSDIPVRYPAIQAQAITLAQLRRFGILPKLDTRMESALRTFRNPSGRIESVMVSDQVLGQWILTDDHKVTPDSLVDAFFNLGERPGLPKAEDVVALFEMAWKVQARPIYARVKYHPETKSILLRGTPEEVVAAQRAYASLTGRPLPAEPALSENPFDNITETLKKIAELIEKQSEGKDK